jgi:hypothetical protein
LVGHVALSVMERGEGRNLRDGRTTLKGRRVTGLPALAAAARGGMRNARSEGPTIRATDAPKSIMQHAAEAAHATPTTSPPPRPIRALPVEEVQAPDPIETVIRRLAADRLRDLRDDGLTLAYAARMYGLDAGEMAALEAELLPWRQR